MEEKLIDWCAAHFPLLTVLALIILATIIATYKLTMSYSKMTGRIKDTEEQCRAINQNILPDIANIKQSVDGISKSISTILVYLKGKDTDFEPSLFMSKSPIRLTPLGQKILEDIGGKSFVDQNLDALISDMNAVGIKTALDSQNIAPLVITQHASDDAFTPIKDYIFNHPFYLYKNEDGVEFSTQLDIATVAKILGIYLRDKYLETRPELNPDDIP